MNIKLYLAPMDGVTDFIMRDLLTRIGGIDFCVTEFLRVTDNVYSDKIFYEHCPELKINSTTKSGVPTYLQFLGNNAELMAANSYRACELGAKGIDLNFGCPAKTVNKHNGGAILLKDPSIIFKITQTVRLAVPKNIPVSVKIRLGYDDPTQCFENVKAIEEAGANWITIHCRTKIDGYKPPAYWEWIPKISELSAIPIVANGEINSVEDFYQCKKVTHCSQFMIGRASLFDPFIFLKIKKSLSNEDKNFTWADIAPMLLPFYRICEESVHSYYAIARTKQWLKYLAKSNIEATDLFEKMKTITLPDEFRINMEQTQN
jgi:tRNA-dihydrouridine synthase C